MYDHAITEQTLRQKVSKADFIKYPELHVEVSKTEHIVNALKKAKTGFSAAGIKIKASVANGKDVYRFSDFCDELLIRKLNCNLRRIYPRRQSDRDTIVTNLIHFLSEGVQYRVYKLDIKSFYESIDVLGVVKCLRDAALVSRQCGNILETMMLEFGKKGVTGAPRGIALSATLAEIEIRTFDLAVREDDRVFFYSRYVDDIIIITSGYENKNEFLQFLEGLLPVGLKLNSKKQYTQKVERIKNDGSMLAVFNYLGYNLKVTNPNSGSANYQHRKVSLDIAPQKVKKMKTRLILSVLSYLKDHDYDLFLSRVKLLAGNYSVIDTAKNIKRKAGIYYSYKYVTESNSIGELDSFLRKMLLSRQGKLFDNLYNALSKEQRRQMLKLTFSNGFNKRVFYHFGPKRLAKVLGAWKYE